MKNIVINMNSSYYNYSLVMLKSLFDNNQQSQFCVYLIYSNVTCDEIERLKRFTADNNSQLVALKVNQDIFLDFPRQERWTVETYYRLLIADLLPNNVKKVLYLDIDIIVNNNIDELFEMNIDNYYMAVCEERSGNIDIEKINYRWKREVGTKYFNAGVMLMNLEKMRQDVTFASYVEAVKQLECDLPYMDQDLMNYLLGENVKYIEADKYNNVIQPDSVMPYYDSVIYHYGTVYKPWKEVKDTAYYRIWWKYAEKILQTNIKNIKEKKNV